MITKDGEVAKGHEVTHTNTGNDNTANHTKTNDTDVKDANASQTNNTNTGDGVVKEKVVIKDVEGQEVIKGAEQAAKQTMEVTGHSKSAGLFSFLHHKQDHIFTIEKTGDINKDVENYAYQAAIQEQLQKAGIQSPNPAQIKAATDLVDQKGYAITGSLTDENGQEHKFKVIRGKDGSITRTVDGEKAKINVTQNGDNKVEYSTFKHVKLPANTVLDPEAQAKATAGGGTYVAEKMDKLRGVLTTKENNMNTTYKAITDGDTKNDFIVKEQAGKVVEVRKVGNAASVLKQLSQNAQKTH